MLSEQGIILMHIDHHYIEKNEYSLTYPLVTLTPLELGHGFILILLSIWWFSFTASEDNVVARIVKIVVINLLISIDRF